MNSNTGSAPGRLDLLGGVADYSGALVLAVSTRATVVDEMLDHAGVHGARSSGGGPGGTVVVLCDRGAIDDVDDLIR
jgi:galactokinase